MKWPSRLAWALYAWGLLLLAGGLVLLAVNGRVPAEAAIDNALDLAPIVAGAVAIGGLGALVASRQPRNLIGWSFLAAALGFAYAPMAEQYVLRAYVVSPGSLPLADWAAWTHDTVEGVTIFLPVLMIVYLFPSGRLVSRRWRAPFALGLTAIAFQTIAAALSPVLRPDLLPKAYPDIVNPLSTPTLLRVVEPVVGLGFLAFPLFVVVGAVSLVVRARRSDGVERQQLKWVALSGLVAVLGGVGTILAMASVPIFRTTLIAPGLFIAGLGSIPFTASIAILRYRLWDIDRIISRTATYAIVTALLGGTFALLVLLPVLLGVDEAPDYLIAAATLVVAALFRPVRRRVQRAVDHRFNRKRYDVERTIEAFTARLRDEIDLETIGDELSVLVRGSMQPAHASLWVRSR